MLINAKPRISVKRGSGVGVGVNGRFDPATPANSNETTPLVAVTVVKGVVVSTTRYALPPDPVTREFPTSLKVSEFDVSIEPHSNANEYWGSVKVITIEPRPVER